MSVVIAGCGNASREREDYGDIQNRAGGVALSSETQHERGWGRRECVLCHNIELNVHQGKDSLVDPKDIVNGFNRGGDAYCLTCHGPNGL